ncbi:hypothetical protein [Marinobacter sp.]|uniref:hypothetical protein n=1 Tax=Marinobacter sp. TaxID=50741 RepID=UPI003A8F9612
MTLSPSRLAGLLATTPWLVLLTFLVAAALAGKPWLLAASPLVLAGLLRQYRCHGLLRGRHSVSSLSVEQGQLYAATGDHRRVPVITSSASRIWSGLALLKLRPAGARFRSYTTILLAPSSGTNGNCPEDEFRRLRMWLRLGRARPSST